MKVNSDLELLDSIISGCVSREQLTFHPGYNFKLKVIILLQSCIIVKKVVQNNIYEIDQLKDPIYYKNVIK